MVEPGCTAIVKHILKRHPVHSTLHSEHSCSPEFPCRMSSVQSSADHDRFRCASEGQPWLVIAAAVENREVLLWSFVQMRSGWSYHNKLNQHQWMRRDILGKPSGMTLNQLWDLRVYWFTVHCQDEDEMSSTIRRGRRRLGGLGQPKCLVDEATRFSNPLTDGPSQHNSLGTQSPGKAEESNLTALSETGTWHFRHFRDQYQ